MGSGACGRGRILGRRRMRMSLEGERSLRAGGGREGLVELVKRLVSIV